MIVKMAKIRILGSKGILPPVIEILQDQGAIHIESKPAETLHVEETALLRRHAIEGVTEQTREALEAVLEKVKRILLLLPPSPAAPGPEWIELPAETTEGSLKMLSERIGSLESRVDTVVRKRKVHEDELSLLARYQKILEVLTPLTALVRESQELEFMGLAIQAEQRNVIPILEEALSRLTDGHYEVFYQEVDKETLAGLLVFPKDKAAQVKAQLWQENIGEVRLPTSISDKPLAEALKIILRKQVELPGRIRMLDRELLELSRRWTGALMRLRRWLENKIEQILVSASFYETRMTFIIYGWIPKRDLPELRNHLQAKFGSRLVVEERPIEKEEADRIPVELSNRPWARPFELFTRILPLPRYGTIDPTPFLAIFFPLFFGIIIGDIGYGLIFLTAALFLKRKFKKDPSVSNVAAIFTYASVSSILWGVAYGEFFGDLGERWGLHPLLMNRMEDFLQTLFFALAIGVVHILIGIVLGVVTAIRHRRRRELIAKLTGLAQVAGFLVMVMGILGWLPKAAITAGLAVAIAGLPVLILGGGPGAMMELHNLMNILSYLRIMGIGVASVALAFAANKLGSMIDNVLLGVLAGMVLHAVNIAFAVISPVIQSLRLHYVEFFENFFEGGGLEYRPFKRIT